MSEGNGTTDVSEVAESTQGTQPTSFIGDDGTFVEGWRDKYVPEDVRGEAVFDRVKTIQGMAKSLASAERMIGSDKITKPNDKYGDEDWDNYYKAAGWTGEPIPLAAPEGLPEGVWSEDRATQYSERFNQLRLNPKQVEGIVELYKEDIVQQLTDQKNNYETSVEEVRSQLIAEKGNAFTQFQHNGNFAIDKGTAGESPEFKERIVKKYGSDPDLVRLLGNLGSQFGETGAIPKASMAPTPVDINKKIQDIYDSEAFAKPMHPGHKQAMANLARLHKEKATIKQPA